jgi:hypothetical protein
MVQAWTRQSKNQSLPPYITVGKRLKSDRHMYDKALFHKALLYLWNSMAQVLKIDATFLHLYQDDWGRQSLFPP